MRREYDLKSKDSSNKKAIALNTSGTLKCKQIFFRSWNKPSDKYAIVSSLSDFVVEILDQLIASGHRSIAFPAIGCGLFGCSPNAVANGMIKGFLRRQTKHTIHVTIVVQYDKIEVYEAFDQEIKNLNFITPVKPLLNTYMNVKKSIIAITKCDLRQIEVRSNFCFESVY